jgi:hypothetical protein
MTPVLLSIYEGEPYARLARVLAYSAAEHCPEWDRRIEAVTIYKPKQLSVEQRVRQDAAKLLRWVEAVETAPDDTPMLLTDCDMWIRRSLDDVWAKAFDVAYTQRDKTRTSLPLNAGVIFARATAPARRFLRAWYERTQPIRRSQFEIQKARRLFGACDQAGLAATLASTDTKGVNILTLPCREWNCEDSEWGRFDPKLTRIVHVKGGLRKVILKEDGVTEQRRAQVAQLVRQWQAVERAACA